MNKGLIRSAVLIGVTAAAVAPAFAQDQDEFGSLRQRLRVEQNFGVGDNLGLENPSEGRTSLAATRVTYGLQSETKTQKLSLAIGAGLRFGNIAPGNEMKTGFVDPLFALRYNRTAANATFSFDADYQETDISLQQPLWTFLDQDGVVTPPSDFANIRGSGERRSYNVLASMETGLLDPLGLRLTAGASGTDYIDATDPTLLDYETTNIGLTTLFRFNSVTTGTIDLAYSTYNSEGSEDRESETRTLEAGFERELSTTSRLKFSAGHTSVDTYETNAITGARVLTKTGGPSGSIGYENDRPNGTFLADFSVSQNREGERGTLLFTRALSLPSGSLSANIGLTKFERTDPRLIGGINWVYNLPTSSISLQYKRGVFTDSSDDERFSDLLIAGYAHEINSVSKLTADLSLSYNEGSLDQIATKRGSLVLAYNHEINKDWSFNTGVAFNTLRDDVIGEADSSAVFFGIGRNFDLSR